jgi:hypothetical protein
VSERKTEEIKFRVAPSVKAAWQAEAERLELKGGVSELIHRRMQEAQWAEQNKAMDGIPTIRKITEWLPRPKEASVEPCACEFGDGDPPACLSAGECLGAASPQEDEPVGTSDEVGAKEEPKLAYPWMFDA